MAQRLDVRYVNYYTDGSAARKIAPVQPFKTLKLPKLEPRKHRVIHIDPFALAGFAVAVVMLIVMTVGVSRYVKLQKDIAVMESYVQTLREENAELTSTYKDSYDLEEVRKNVLAMGFVPRDQVKHITLTVPQEEDTEKAGAFEIIGTFLTGLFA